MENNKIIILKELIKSFDRNDFDLEAWKLKSSIVLKKIFGETDSKTEMIEQLQYNYSSWSLRDHSGGKQHDSIKIQAKEIIEAAIMEIKLSDEEKPIQDILLEHLSEKKIAKLLDLIKKNDQKGVLSLISNTNKETKDLLLSQILLNIAK